MTPGVALFALGVLVPSALVAAALWVDRRAPRSPSSAPYQEPEDDDEPTLVSVYAHPRELPETWDDETAPDSPADLLSRRHAR